MFPREAEAAFPGLSFSVEWEGILPWGIDRYVQYEDWQAVARP